MRTSAAYRMKWLGWTLAALWAVGAPLGAAAQAIPAESITIALWPEYDRPEVLVIYRVTLSASTALPARLRLLVPGDAPPLTAAAFRGETGELLNASPTRSDGDPYDVVELDTPSREVQIEFYLPYEVEGDVRRFAFTWPGGAATDAFTFEVQQPRGAEAMDISPAPTSETVDGQGLLYHLVPLGPQSEEDRPQVSFTYRKTTPDLSVNAGSTSVLATLVPTDGAPLAAADVLPWVLLAGGVVAIGAGVVYFLRTRAEDRPVRPRHRPARRLEERPDEVDASPVFCHNCGTMAPASDRFCRQCGTALRS